MEDRTTLRYSRDLLPLPTARIRELLDYDPIRGVVAWKAGFPIRCVLKQGREAGRFTREGYRAICIDGVHYHAGRIAWFLHHGVEPTEYVEPVNGIKDDLRLENLREVTSAERSIKRPPGKNNTSGFKGVSWAKGFAKWHAYITKDDKRTTLGYFETAAAAALAYNAAAFRLFGNRAYLNQVPQ